MRPGDVASLSQSGEVAFRAKFEGEIPPASRLYWRGLVFSKLEDGAWSSLGYYDLPLKERRARDMLPVGEALNYSIIVEPHSAKLALQPALRQIQFARSDACARLSTVFPQPY